MTDLLLLGQLAIRNLFSSFLNFVVGGIIFIGTLLFVVGGSLLNSIDSSMSRSIVGSVAGHIQVYAADSKEEMEIFKSWSSPDINAISDFSKIKGPLMAHENVKSVIPMGIEGAMVSYGNTVDQILERLRKAIYEKQKGPQTAELAQRIESLKSHVRHMVNVIQTDFKNYSALAASDSIDKGATQVLQKASSPEFWNSFDNDPLGSLEYLENHIAALIPDADFIYLQYVGTDLDAFRGAFDRMQVVDGEMVPSGQRGMMLAKYQYEEQFKMKTARRLDKISEALTDKGKKIAVDPDLRLMVKQNRTQTREIVLQLDPLSAQTIGQRLRAFLKVDEKELDKLLNQFFDMNDSNFEERYRFFYGAMAPLFELYRLKPGDTLTIKAYTKSGFVQSANVKIYGTFHFKGLEKSGLAGGLSLMDLMSFRDLYNFVTPEKLAETQELKKATGTTFVSRDDAEAQLFGGSSVVQNTKSMKIDEQTELGDNQARLNRAAIANQAYTSEQIEKGAILNAAIILKDPTRLNQTLREINELSKAQNLNLKALTWQKAAGTLGQFVTIGKLILYFAVFVIFIVALVIINNAVMMATLQRVREIGTMRAIGAQRSFVLSLVLIETLLLGIVFGVGGTALGAVVVQVLGKIGIPAANDFLYFFFAGPRLHVTLGMGSLVGAFVIICVVTAISALYPAIVATRVSPLQAMQTED